jgi:hypothetical protein
LHQAVLENSIELIRLLLENNANVNSFDEDSWTPLHAAASLGFYDVTKYIFLKKFKYLLTLSLFGLKENHVLLYKEINLFNKKLI